MTLDDLVRLRRARDMMDRDYAQPLDVPALARASLMSPGHFSRSFRAAFGETPYSYLMTRRVERAKALLRRGDLSVTEVCFEVGCTSLGSFSSRFTELVGETPSAYRARSHDPGAVIPACVAKILTRPVRNGPAGNARVLDGRVLDSQLPDGQISDDQVPDGQGLGGEPETGPRIQGTA
ncbi:helix-turn-helix transcriptional regulator [Streptomyces sp. NPDC048527]|uniref:helix-turn-helix transcriptional regulator n=1 Tax=Streptomyces sp. NPDC048527 TaxID=3365568 RepID=UPI0037225EDD